jgi:hypothetical protein
MEFIFDKSIENMYVSVEYKCYKIQKQNNYS